MLIWASVQPNWLERSKDVCWIFTTTKSPVHCVLAAQCKPIPVEKGKHAVCSTQMWARFVAYKEAASSDARQDTHMDIGLDDERQHNNFRLDFLLAGRGRLHHALMRLCVSELHSLVGACLAHQLGSLLTASTSRFGALQRHSHIAYCRNTARKRWSLMHQGVQVSAHMQNQTLLIATHLVSF